MNAAQRGISSSLKARLLQVHPGLRDEEAWAVFEEVLRALLGSRFDDANVDDLEYREAVGAATIVVEAAATVLMTLSTLPPEERADMLQRLGCGGHAPPRRR